MKKFICLAIAVVVSVFGLSVLLAPSAYAAQTVTIGGENLNLGEGYTSGGNLYGGNTNSIHGEREIKKKVARAAEVIAFLTGTVSIIVIVYAGISYATSLGDPGKMTKAKQMIFAALIGIIITVLASAVAIFLVNSLTA